MGGSAGRGGGGGWREERKRLRERERERARDERMGEKRGEGSKLEGKRVASERVDKLSSSGARRRESRGAMREARGTRRTSMRT